MSNISDHTLSRLDALNNWLGDVYGEGIHFGTLLTYAGFSELDIEKIKQEYLSEFLQAVIDILASYGDLHSEHRAQLMIQYYGLIDGELKDFYTIGHSVGVNGERIRQLVTKRLVLFHEPNRQAKFHDDFAAIARRLLDS